MAIPQNSGSKELSKKNVKNHQVEDSFYDDQDFSNESEAQFTMESLNNIPLNSIIMMKNRPHRLIDKIWSKPGKHGSAKVVVVGKDFFTDKRTEDSWSSQDKVMCPAVIKQEYQVLQADGNRFLDILNLDTCEQWDNFEVDSNTMEQVLEKMRKNPSSSLLISIVSIGQEGKIVSMRMEQE